MTTNVDITNRALAEIGTRSQITSMSDGSWEAIYANILYNPLRDFMLREGDYDFATTYTSAIAETDIAIYPWIYAYQYPSTCIRIRQLVPQVVTLLDPQNVEWNIIGVSGARHILTRIAIGNILYTSTPIEDVWDSIFTEAFVRLLGSALAFALENRIEASREKLSEALSFAGIANLRDE